ncbi:MAG: Ig-like domain-containing protein, partial [Prevotellaceae bacterium]|nr:Ig-like domain-containing protein [Prevotellaceae bacterium]
MKRDFFKMVLVCLFTVVAISSCKKDEKDSVEVTGVTLNKHTLTLAVASSETLTATVTPDNADDKTVVWTISGTTKDVAPVTVVSVTNGLVTAIAEGSAKIIATAGSKSDTCVVTVIAGTISSKTYLPKRIYGTYER